MILVQLVKLVLLGLPDALDIPDLLVLVIQVKLVELALLAPQDAPDILVLLVPREKPVRLDAQELLVLLVQLDAEALLV